MGIVIGFIPWIVYWILVGNIPFTTAVTIAFGITLLIQLILRVRSQPIHTLDVGNLIVFAILTLAAYLVPDNVLERWLQPLSSLGLFLIALVGLLIGRPFVREYAVESVDADTAKTQGFRTITTAMTWMWVIAFGLMFVSAMIPPLVDGAATIRDMDNTLSIICYWVIPYTVLGIAGAVSATFPPWFDKRSAEIDKRTAVAPAVAAQPVPPPDLAAGGLTIDAPAESRLDEPFAVIVTGGKAGSTVEVTTSGNDLFGRSWRSRAAFTVPTNGIVDLSMVAAARHRRPGSRLAGGGWHGPDLGDAIRGRGQDPGDVRAADRAVAADGRRPRHRTRRLDRQRHRQQSGVRPEDRAAPDGCRGCCASNRPTPATCPGC